MSKDKMSEEQFDDSYLWDGTGEPDPEIMRLERSLAQFRHKGEVPAFPVAITTSEQNSWFSFLSLLWPRRFAAIAASAALVIATSILVLRNGLPAAQRPGWEVARTEGAPLVGVHRIETAGGKSKLEVGQLLVTNGNSRAIITVAEIGEIQVDPDTRVRLLQTGRDRKRVSLEEGTIHAAIWAPPGEFVVDTPSATAVDLGCAYTLHVAPDGSGLLRTTLGWVGFHSNGRDSFIPAGAVCPTHKNLGPGIPYMEDASEPFRNALAQFDFTAESPDSRAAALRTVLSQSRKDDALTLWHLLSRTSGAEREKVYDRFASLVRPPDGVTRDGILRLDQQQLDLWWNALGFGDISIWRFWEQGPDKSAPTNAQLLQKKQAVLEKSR